MNDVATHGTASHFLRKHALELGAGLIAFALVLSGHVTVAAARRAIDVDLLLILFALLITVEILRASGFLDATVATCLRRFRGERSLSVALIALSGLLAALLTNDVALFVIIPITVIAGRLADLAMENVIVLEIVATNLLGCLTPLGNPQNLFLFHRSGWNAVFFIRTMLPFVALSAAGLLIATLVTTHAKGLSLVGLPDRPRDGSMALAGASCFVLVILEIAHLLDAWPAAIAAAIAGIYFLRRGLFAIDLSIVPLFLFAFVIVKGLRALQLPAAAGHLYASSIALSQILSNVPTAILLSPLAAGRWRELLYGVNAGGCGTIIASLANLLGWRIYTRESNGDPHFFRRLSIVNVAFLIWIGVGAWSLL